MPKFSQITTNASPATSDFVIGVTAGGVDDKITLAQLAALVSANITAGAVKAAALDLSSGSQINSYTNTGSAGGTVHWINLGGLRIAWIQGAVGNVGAWNVVNLTPVGYTNPPTVSGNTNEMAGTAPGWVEFASRATSPAGAPDVTGFTFLCRQSTGANYAGTIQAIVIGT